MVNAEKLIIELEKLQDQKTYIFRGQPDSKFSLSPKAFRPEDILALFNKFPLPHKQWRYCEALKKIVGLYLRGLPLTHIWVERIFELTMYVLAYNYSLAKYIHGNEENFNQKTIDMHKLRGLDFWTVEKTFIGLFQYRLNLSIGRIGLNSEIINYSRIDEELAGYDDTLPQHYGVPTAAFDWTLNPYKALYFSLQEIPENATHFAIYAYKEISRAPTNPFSIEHGNPTCKNERIIAQEGCFIRFKYPCLFYFFHGKWPTMETYSTLNQGNFELISYEIPISNKNYLLNILNKKQITKKSLKLETPDSN